MNVATALQVKNLLTFWLIAGNGLLALWAGLLYLRRSASSPLFFNFFVFLQGLVFVTAAVGVYLVAAGAPTNSAHLMYGVLNGILALTRLGLHPRLVRTGAPGLVWHGLLALLAVALVARSSATAFH